MEIHVYQDLRGEWRWRLVADNGRTVADSAEGYDSEHNVHRAINTVQLAFQNVPKVVKI